MSTLLLITLSLLRMKGFTEQKISSHHPHEARWESPQTLSQKQINQILSMPYHYLGSGKECYVFASQDNQYVIKLFKQKHMDLTSWHSEQVLKKHAALREKSFTSYKIAHEKLPKQTGLLYLHLTKSDHLRKKLHLTDNHNRPFTLNLDQAEFLIQRRGTPLLTYLETQNKEQIETLIPKLITFIQERAELGIQDEDNNCEHNLGVIDGEIFEIDVGEFSLAKQPPDIQEELKKATVDLRNWLAIHYPDLVTSLTNPNQEL